VQIGREPQRLACARAYKGHSTLRPFLHNRCLAIPHRSSTESKNTAARLYCPRPVTVNHHLRSRVTSTRATTPFPEFLELSKAPARALPRQNPARARFLPVSVDPLPQPTLVKFPRGIVSPIPREAFSSVELIPTITD
jgi:hypothetical protein